MALYLRGLAGVAFLAPAADIAIHAMPNKVGGDGSLRWLDTGMGQPMDGFKNTSGPIGWDDGSGLSGGDVAEDHEVLKRNIGETQTSASLVGDHLLGILLIVGQATVVDCREGDRRQIRGPGVGDNIVLPLDVAYIRGELGYKGEVTGLSRRPRRSMACGR